MCHCCQKRCQQTHKLFSPDLHQLHPVSFCSRPAMKCLPQLDDKCCRICLSGDRGFLREPLISPCQCRGSMAHVHKTCLFTWLTTSGSNTCDLCGHTPSLRNEQPSLLNWLLQAERRIQLYVLMDLVSLILLTPMTAACLNFCLRGLLIYHNNRFQTIGLIILMVLLVLTYTIWLSTCLLQHYRNWRNWRGRFKGHKRLQLYTQVRTACFLMRIEPFSVPLQTLGDLKGDISIDMGFCQPLSTRV